MIGESMLSARHKRKDMDLSLNEQFREEDGPDMIVWQYN